VKLRKSGYETITRSIVVNPGKQSILSPELPPGQATTSQVPVAPANITYVVSTAPRWAQVFLDGDTTNLNEGGRFEVTLREGMHKFTVINERAGVYKTFRYDVKRSDANKKLILNYVTGEVIAKRD
jgi:hypothetical protein